MHLNILQGLHWLRFEGVELIDIPIGSTLRLSTRAQIVTEVVEGKVATKHLKMPNGTGSQHPAHLYTSDVPLPSDGPTASQLMQSFDSRSLLFLEALWLVKDNSGAPGGLYGVTIGPEIRQCNLPHSPVPSNARCTKAWTVFSRDELTEAVDLYNQLVQLMPKEDAKADGPPPMALRHPSRLGRALYLTQGARDTSEVGIKTALYCIAFECLFSTVVDGATECVADRGSRFIEDTDAGRKAARRRFQKLYQYRSRVVHGSAITPKHEPKLRASAVAADEDLRKTLRKILADQALTELFSTDDPSRLNTYFDGS
jgi:hypothetical protein